MQKAANKVLRRKNKSNVLRNKMKPKILIVWIIIINTPIICWFLRHIVDWGLIPLFIEAVYYFPLSWIGEPLFVFISDIGAYIPTNTGRIVGVFLYSVVFWLLYLVLFKRKA